MFGQEGGGGGGGGEAAAAAAAAANSDRAEPSRAELGEGLNPSVLRRSASVKRGLNPSRVLLTVGRVQEQEPLDTPETNKALCFYLFIYPSEVWFRFSF